MSADFTALRARLRSAFQSDVGDADQARSAAILRERRRVLASRQLEDSTREVLAQVIVVRRAAVRLGVPVTAATEVREVEVAAVPGSGAIVNGVFQVRGRCTGLVDLAPFFGQSTPPRGGRRSLIVVVTGAPGRLGLRIDEIVDVRTLFADELESSLGDTQLAFVRQITRDGVHVVDVDALMTMPEIRVTGSCAP